MNNNIKGKVVVITRSATGYVTLVNRIDRTTAYPRAAH